MSVSSISTNVGLNSTAAAINIELLAAVNAQQAQVAQLLGDVTGSMVDVSA